MVTKKKKTKVVQEEKQLQAEENLDQLQTQRLSLVHSLANSGEMGYQALVKWQETNDLLKDIKEALEKIVQKMSRRNELLIQELEGSEDSEEEEEDEEEEDDEEE